MEFVRNERYVVRGYRDGNSEDSKVTFYFDDLNSALESMDILVHHFDRLTCSKYVFNNKEV